MGNRTRLMAFNKCWYISEILNENESIKIDTSYEFYYFQFDLKIFSIYVVDFFWSSHQHDRDIDQYINICNWKCEVCGQCVWENAKCLVLRMHKYFPSAWNWWEEISLLTRKNGNVQCLLHSIKSPQRNKAEKIIWFRLQIDYQKHKNLLEASLSCLCKMIEKMSLASSCVPNTKYIDWHSLSFGMRDFAI